MSKVGLTSGTGRKKGIVLWPSFVMLASSLVFWVFFYYDPVGILIMVLSFCFSLACVVCFLIQVALREPKRALSFLIPLLLYFATGPVPPISIFAKGRDPIMIPMVRARDHIEFLIYDARYHLRAETRQKQHRYKEWRLDKQHSDESFYIVYDVTDGIARNNHFEGDGCLATVLRMEEHFYFVTEHCGSL